MGKRTVTVSEIIEQFYPLIENSECCLDEYIRDVAGDLANSDGEIDVESFRGALLDRRWDWYDGIDFGIVYYGNAMEFLAKHDPSLHESLSIADEFGYSLKDLNSEVLASLLNRRLQTEDADYVIGRVIDFVSDYDVIINK